MNNKFLVVSAVFLLLFIFCGAASAATVKTSHVNTGKLNVGTNNFDPQENPDIDGNMVVWEQWNMSIESKEKRSIYVKNLATNYIGKLMNSNYDQANPKVSGDRVVWEEWDNNHAIYMKNLKTHKVAKIGVGTLPDISGGIIVWESWYTPGAIMYLDLYNGKKGLVVYGKNIHYPQISGSRVVWQQYSNHVWNIWAKNLANNNIAKVSPSSKFQFNPQISGTRVIWAQNLGTYKDGIYYRNLVTGKTLPVWPFSGMTQFNQVISDGLIAWSQSVVHNPDLDVGSYILYRNLLTGVKGIINGFDPSISGVRIAFVALDPSTNNQAIYIKNTVTHKIWELTA